MKLSTVSIAGVLAMCLAAATAWADQQADTAAIAAVNAEFEAAVIAGSAARLAGVYTADGQVLPPNSPPVSGTEGIRAFWQAVVDSGVGGAELDTVELDVMGDTAIELGVYRLKTPDGAAADNGKFIVIWKKVDGEWKWHRDIFSSSNPAN